MTIILDLTTKQYLTHSHQIHQVMDGEKGWRAVATGVDNILEASRSCYELIHCGCKKGCSCRCKCIKAVLKCPALFSCSGDRQN